MTATRSPGEPADTGNSGLAIQLLWRKIMHVRAADTSELDHLAQLWYDGWRDAHAAIVPADLTKLRTRDTFRPRLEAGLADIRVVGPLGTPVGFCMLRGDELYQLFVAAHARGTGAAAALMADAEARLAARGVRTTWLTCAIGNHRAARFYEKWGWRRVGSIVDTLDTTAGPFRLEVWRYQKDLT